MDHLFSTDYTCSISRGLQFLGGCIWISFIHVGRRLAVSNEGHKFLSERPKSYINVSDNMKRQAIVGKNDREKCQICKQFKEIFTMLEQ